jgi:hypothetical protein
MTTLNWGDEEKLVSGLQYEWRLKRLSTPPQAHSGDTSHRLPPLYTFSQPSSQGAAYYLEKVSPFQEACFCLLWGSVLAQRPRGEEERASKGLCSAFGPFPGEPGHSWPLRIATSSPVSLPPPSPVGLNSELKRGTVAGPLVEGSQQPWLLTTDMTSAPGSMHP